MRNLNKLLFTFSLLIILSQINLASSAHVITPTSFNALEDVQKFFNITVNNSDTTSSANITQVNITLPNSFTFRVSTNGTDAGTHTFTNTSTVLSWSNNNLIMNQTLKRFWFNATASTPGTYNITVTTLNASGTSTSYIAVTINDTNAPVIFLISPSNGASSNTTSYTFEFNSTDEGTLSNCSLIIDGSVSSISTTLNSTGGSNTIAGGPFSVGAHTWSINCTDSAGNTANSSTWSFTVEETTATTEEVSSSGGTGSPTYTFTQKQLLEGKKQIVQKNYKFKLPNNHLLTINNVGSKVDLTLASTPQTASLGAGEEKTFSLDNNRLSIKVESVQGKIATLFLVMQEGPLVTETPKPVEPPAPKVEEKAAPTQPTPQLAPQKENNSGWIIGLIIIIVLVLIATAVYFAMKYKKGPTPKFKNRKV